MSGWLGCPNCRRDYPISEGVADLRLDPASAPPPRPPLQADELALKIVALCGLGEEREMLLVDERLAHAAPAVLELAPELEVIVARWSPSPAVEQRGVSRLLVDSDLPLVEYRLAGVAIAPGGDRDLVAAAARRVRTGGRLVLFEATAADVEAVERSGLHIVAREGETAVAERKSDPQVLVQLSRPK